MQKIKQLSMHFQSGTFQTLLVITYNLKKHAFVCFFSYLKWHFLVQCCSKTSDTIDINWIN